MVKPLGSFLVWRPFGKGVFEKKETICVKYLSGAGSHASCQTIDMAKRNQRHFWPTP